jgi:hypothetical protein
MDVHLLAHYIQWIKMYAETVKYPLFFMFMGPCIFRYRGGIYDQQV